MPPGPRPPIVQHLSLLNEFLGVRPKYPGQCKVIAIDGFDRNAVQMLIAKLSNHIKRIKCTVRVIDDDFTREPEVPVDRSTQLCGYIRQIHNWGMMWNKIAEAPSPPPTRAGPCAGPVIYLLPLSPLMATIRASDHLALTGTYCTIDHWRWLASHWSGHPRPDITINIEDMATVSMSREIIRLQGSDMNTLVVTKGLDGGVDLGPQQLHRVMFEVGDWLVSG